MGRKRKNVDYRQLYRDYFGIEFDNTMVIHHIDFDRTNNDIDNLIMIPRRLHAKYHLHVSQLGGTGDGIINYDMRVNGDTYRIQELRGLADALDEIMQWVRIKWQMEQMKSCGLRWNDVVK